MLLLMAVPSSGKCLIVVVILDVQVARDRERRVISVEAASCVIAWRRYEKKERVGQRREKNGEDRK